MKHAGLLALVVVITLAGCTGGAGDAPGDGPDTGDGTGTVSGNATVTITDAGFQPARITVEQGTTVTWVNEGSQAAWPASDVHPQHTQYPGGDYDQSGSYAGSSACTGPGDQKGDAFDACQRVQPGDSWSFTFEETGTWQYHNHLSPSMAGTVVVE